MCVVIHDMIHRLKLIGVLYTFSVMCAMFRHSYQENLIFYFRVDRHTTLQSKETSKNNSMSIILMKSDTKVVAKSWCLTTLRAGDRSEVMTY